jgi:hypothetical protein
MHTRVLMPRKHSRCSQNSQRSGKLFVVKLGRPEKIACGTSRDGVNFNVLFGSVFVIYSDSTHEIDLSPYKYKRPRLTEVSRLSKYKINILFYLTKTLALSNPNLLFFLGLYNCRYGIYGVMYQVDFYTGSYPKPTVKIEGYRPRWRGLQAVKTDLIEILGKLDSVIDLELLNYT